MPDDANNSGSPARARALAWLRALDRTPASAHEALALAVHAVLLAHGFRDVALPDAPANAFDEQNQQPSRLRDDWGAGGWGGRYRHARSALEFEVRATPLGARLRVTGAHDAEGGDAATLDLPVADHYAAEGEQAHWTDALRDVDATATLVLVNVAHRLVPDAAKEGYEAAAPPVGSSGAGSSGAANGGGGAERNPPASMQPRPLYEDDPLRAGPVRGGPGYPYPGIPGMTPGFPGMPGGEPGFGADDLMPQFPLGPGGGLGGGLGGNLMGPGNFPGMGPRPGGRGGYPVGPRGPGFPGGPGGVPGGGHGRGGRFPGQGPVPGARYDPMGPGGVGPDNNIERPPDDDPPSGMYW